MFKVGDRVKRTVCSNTDVHDVIFRVGELGTVENGGISSHLVAVRLDKNGHLMQCLPEYLEKVEEKVSTNRYNVTEQKRYIKEKRYDIFGREVRVSRNSSLFVNVSFGGTAWTKQQLREAAILFNELADALEEGFG